MVTMATQKRNLFEELKKGVDDINAYKAQKMTLRTHHVEKKSRLKIDATFVRKTREALNMSQNVFALKLHVSPRTLQKWEQGETTPNDQAAVLISMVRKYPDTLKRLEEI